MAIFDYRAANAKGMRASAAKMKQRESMPVTIPTVLSHMESTA